MLSALLTPSSGSATAKGQPDSAAICRMIEEAAVEHGVPITFFARLIWKESRFDIRAVSPAGAQGVAQFMPATAAERGLADPFDPKTAIPASASLLADLKEDFGNFGLAAAAYNAGSGRVQRWIKGETGLPAETRDYVLSITGRPATWFLEKGRRVEEKPIVPGKSFPEGCAAFPIVETRSVRRPAWGVVIAGGRNSRAANIAAERVRRASPQLLAREQIIIVRRPRKATGASYTAQITADTRERARALCLGLRRKGVTCTIKRN